MAMKYWDKKINFVPINSIDKKAQRHKVFLVFPTLYLLNTFQA